MHNDNTGEIAAIPQKVYEQLRAMGYNSMTAAEQKAALGLARDPDGDLVFTEEGAPLADLPTGQMINVPASAFDAYRAGATPLVRFKSEEERAEGLQQRQNEQMSHRGNARHAKKKQGAVSRQAQQRQRRR